MGWLGLRAFHPSSMEMILSYGLWIQTGAIVASLIGVILTISNAKRIATRRATLDLVMMDQSNSGLIRMRRRFIELKEKGNLVQWASAPNKASLETLTILGILNRYELLAIGISEGTLNARIYKRWYRTTVVSDWIHCHPFVSQIRHDKQNAVFWKEYETLVRSWATQDELRRF